MVLNYYLKLSPALLKVITEASHSSLFQILCGKLRAAASDLIRDLIRTLRVTLDYFNAPAFACLNKPHHHRYRTCPEHDVITYTIVCCKRQAISNPIGLNLHLVSQIYLFVICYHILERPSNRPIKNIFLTTSSLYLRSCELQLDAFSG